MLLLQAYFVVAPAIACYAEYGEAMAEHLLHAKLQHWDPSLRDLAARGLARLVPCQPRLLSTSALDTIIPLCRSNTVEVSLFEG